ncbi:MAG: hypothetical protein P8X74_13430, partial [Reinekea sp.]
SVRIVTQMFGLAVLVAAADELIEVVKDIMLGVAEVVGLADQLALVAVLENSSSIPLTCPSVRAIGSGGSGRSGRLFRSACRRLGIGTVRGSFASLPCAG